MCMASVLVTHPIDTVKSLLQSLTASKYRGSALACAADVWRTDGFKGFYRGVAARMCRVPLENALQFALYEMQNQGKKYWIQTAIRFDALDARGE